MSLQTKTFTYGGTGAADSKYYKTVLTLTEESVNIEQNTSTIRYSLVLYAGNTRLSQYRTGAKITLNGNLCAHRDGMLYENQISISANEQCTLMEGSTDIAHGQDGTLQMSVSFEVYHPITDYYTPGNFTYSGGAMELTRIPRHSTLASASGNAGETVSLTVTKQSDSFYHSIRYKHPDTGAYYHIGADGSSVEDETLLRDTTIQFKIPISFSDALNGNLQGSVMLECWTYTENDKTKWLQGSKDAILTFYPLPSVAGDASGVIGETTHIPITRQSTDFYHSIRYKHPGDAKYYYIDANGNSLAEETLLSVTMVPFVVPDLYSVIPNSTSGTFEIECWTYPANSKSVFISQKTTATFTFKADASKCAPTVTGTVQDTNAAVVAITGDPGVLVRYASKAKVEISATAKNGASIADPSKDVSIKYQGVWRYNQNLTFEFRNVEQSSFDIWAKDSRGYEKYGVISAKSFVPYVQLTNDAYAKRENQTGSSVTIYFTGNYYAGEINGTQNTLRLWYKFPRDTGWVEVDRNAERVSWSVDEENNTYIVAVQLDDLQYTSTFSVETCARDLLGEKNVDYDVYKTITIPAGKPVFDWGKEDFHFNVPVDMPALKIGGEEIDLVVECGTYGGWTYRKWSSGIAECWENKSGAVSCNEAWGSLYYGTIRAEQFPADLFVEIPTLSATLENPRMFIVKAAATKEATGVIYAVSPQKISEPEGYHLQLVAKGKWKQEG